jgi:hypothetical protein
MTARQRRLKWAWKQQVPEPTAELALMGIAYYGGEKRGVTLRKIVEWSKGGHGQFRHAFEILTGAGLIESAGTNSRGEEKYRIVNPGERKGEQ